MWASRAQAPMPADVGLGLSMVCQGLTVDSKKLEQGRRMIHADFGSSLGFGLGGRSCSNFLASTAYWASGSAPKKDPGKMPDFPTRP